MAHPGAPNELSVNEIAKRLPEACADPRHEFWPDDVSILDEAILDRTGIHGHRQITDVYLLALASRHGGRFVTFEHGFALTVVPVAQRKHPPALIFPVAGRGSSNR